MKFNFHLYRVFRLSVLALAVATLAGGAAAQKKTLRGPRALAVVEMGPVDAAPSSAGKGKPLAKGVSFPRLFPVAILENGQYYDATVFKATPVPLAVQAGVVYDVQHAGVPQGLFTVNEPIQFHGTWVALGNWQAGVTEAPSAKKPAPVPKQDDDGPPRLKRRDAKSSPPVVAPAPVAKKPEPPKPPAAPWLPAISDAEPYDTRPYHYAWTPEWKQRHTNEMLALTQRELAAHRLCRTGPKCAGQMEQVEIRAFDLDTDNDAELVLTARLRRAVSPEQYIYVAVIGRVGWQARVEKVFAALTDDAHLDTDGRLQLIDAVDSDGDGRGELLFRRLHNQTQSFELYRVGRDRVWELFSGAESSL